VSPLGNNKALIVGLGKTGLSCARYLKAQGVPVAVTDSRDQPPGLAELRNESPDMALFLGGFQNTVFDYAEQLIVSPGVSIREPAIQRIVERGIPVIGDIELFARAVKVSVIAITGSNGKSTVTTLLGLMLAAAGKKVAVGGNLGVPALELLQSDIEFYVLELSSFQLETTTSLKPDVAVVLNISADHMDRYINLADYVDTKASIYRQAKFSIFNRDDKHVLAMAKGKPSDHFFSLDEDSEVNFGVIRKDDEIWLAQSGRSLMPVSDLRIPGLHNVANALAALSIGDCLQIPMDTMLQCLREFTGLKHRMQLVAERNGVRWYNDSKGTNVGACIAALEGFSLEPKESKTILIAGGDSKGAEFTPLKEVVREHVRTAILIGCDAEAIGKVIGASTDTVFAGSMELAVAAAKEVAKPGDRILLSPACASFDMFQNYQQRGDAFIAAVKEVLR